jgi:serine/threonine-protein kinase
MEYVDGEDLASLLRRIGKLPQDKAIEIARQLCAGLAAAHDKDVIHRDLKPANIMLDGRGDVRITDFGIAGIATQIRDFGTGTPDYMSPEQLAGEEVTPRSDIYALGIVVCELLTGKRPPRKHSGPVTTELDPDVEPVIRRCLDPNPQMRPASTLAVSAALPRGGALAPVLVRGDTPGRFRLRVGRPAEARAELSTPSIAVLPFANLSADPRNEYFSEGLAEEILNGLTRVPGLRVVARTSAFAFRGKDQDIRDIGQTLKAGAILQGSVRQAGNRTRVAVQLINTGDGYHVWSEIYDREMADIFSIQEEIAQAVVGVMKVKFASGGQRPLVPRGTTKLEAYHACLEGRHYAHQLTSPALARSRACYERAISLDPSYAYAYAGLADYYYALALLQNARPHDVMPLALAAAERALELDPDYAEAYALRGVVRAAYEYRWEAANEDFTRALELNPGSALAHFLRSSRYLQPLGRLEEALMELQLGLDLDPLAPAPRGALPLFLYWAGRNSEAVEQAREIMELFPSYWSVYFVASGVFTASGLAAEGAAAIDKGLAIDPGNAFLLAVRAGLLQDGEPQQARNILRQLEEMAEESYVSPSALYLASAACGELDQSYEWLRRGVDERDLLTATLVRRPMLPGHQNDPRYHALMCELNLDPYSP